METSTIPIITAVSLSGSDKQLYEAKVGGCMCLHRGYVFRKALLYLLEPPLPHSKNHSLDNPPLLAAFFCLLLLTASFVEL